ncbi:hypothetical protein HPB48_023629 [Haemaphysalis longicornis]|uniref:Uncharacterized protein n=1 Tax=Haemaphysalis longicornis TaxID=44386 RepID=A0A9J6H7S8_HAELO|nr:hypothetical protein HPB48_023629 [Haemaphysalis longicornis]
MPECHTADNILGLLQVVAKEWDLPEDIPAFVVTDNGRNLFRLSPGHHGRDCSVLDAHGNCALVLQERKSQVLLFSV